MNREKSIELLSHLIEMNTDRIESYETASNQVKEEDLKNLFSQFIQTSKRCRRQLRREVVQLGGTPPNPSQTSGKFFRAWMDADALLNGSHTRLVLNACESADEVILESYHKGLRHNMKDISAEQQAMLNTQVSFIKNDHEKVKCLRDISVPQGDFIFPLTLFLPKV